MSKRAFRSALVVVVVTFLALGVAGAWAVREVIHYPERNHAGTGVPVALKIPKGMKLPEVATQLARQGIIDRPLWFRVYAMHRGLANKVRAGDYQLRDDLPPREVLDLLVKGVEEIDVAVTIPEGLHLREVFALISTAGIASAVDLEAAARDTEWLKQQGIEGETAEGYLFPDTYRFHKPTPARQVLETMVKKHRIVYDELRKKNLKTLEKIKKQLDWDDRDIVVMASIVEKETGDPAERPRVASVFYNRLTSPSFPSRRLETDPTIRYGCTIPLTKSKACQIWNPAERLRRAQLDDEENLYNTYQHAGLPPGPISNPGRASIAAAMAPESSSYLYFVARPGDVGSHVFSKTYEEHARNVEKYAK